MQMQSVPLPVTINLMSPKTVLVVEDDKEVRSLLKYIVEHEGYLVREAEDGRDALIQLGLEMPLKVSERGPFQTIVPDLVLLDIMLPEVDGYSILLRMQESVNLRSVPIIVITAKPGMKEMFSIYTNVKYFFAKPFDTKLLREKIKEILQ